MLKLYDVYIGQMFIACLRCTTLLDAERRALRQYGEDAHVIESPVQGAKRRPA